MSVERRGRPSNSHCNCGARLAPQSIITSTSSNGPECLCIQSQWSSIRLGCHGLTWYRYGHSCLANKFSASYRWNKSSSIVIDANGSKPIDDAATVTHDDGSLVLATQLLPRPDASQLVATNVTAAYWCLSNDLASPVSSPYPAIELS